jgi:hypothetical protein
MRFISYVYVFFFFILSFFTCEATFDDRHKVKIRKLSIKECLLPKDHPLQEKLKKLFKNPQMFKSNEHLKRAGFFPLNRDRKPCMVASHPVIKNYFIKKFKSRVSYRRQITNYLNRISAARALRKFIELNNLKHIVVPQKWLYQLPMQFSDPQTGKRLYVLIVEDMHICSGEDDPKGETAKKYNQMDFDTLREFCIVLYHFRGLDSSLRNVPFTEEDTLAFIDTEHWSDENRDFLRHAKKFLSQDRLDYAMAIYEELRKEE